MDIKLSSNDRQVEISNAVGDPTELGDLAFSLWTSMESGSRKSIEGAGFSVTDRADAPVGYAFTEYGERPTVT